MAIRKPGVYVALSANYADDEAIMDAGEDAELMYVRMLAYCARTPLTEGWISDRVVLSRLGILPRMSGNGAGNEPGTDAGSRAGRLCEVGLIHRDEGGYRITSWLKWNKSVEEMGRERARDVERKKPVTSSDAGTGAGNGAGNEPGNGAGLPPSIPLSDQKQIRSEAEHPDKPPRKRGTRVPDDFPITPEMHAWAAENAADLNLSKATEEFIDYWRAIPGQKGVKLDWIATWRTSMRKQQGWADEKKPKIATPAKDDWMYR